MIAKRVLDVVCASLGLLVLSPALLVIAALIAIDSPGPVLFRQERVGRFGKRFRIHKFRTMRSVAEPVGPALTVGADPRITRVGAFLRRYKLDELPQLIDVVRGKMSLVGPRPEVPAYVAHYSEEDQRVVLAVRPGITDLASLTFSDESALLATAADPHQFYVETVLPAKLRMYREYVASRTLVGDIRIIVATIFKLIGRSSTAASGGVT